MSHPNGAGYVERRKAERIYNPFPATVEGVDVNGEPFKIDTVLDNLSRECLYLRLMPCVEVGSSLSVVFYLSTSSMIKTDKARVSLKGKVIRIDMKDGGACGIAISFKPARFIYQDSSPAASATHVN